MSRRRIHFINWQELCEKLLVLPNWSKGYQLYPRRKAEFLLYQDSDKTEIKLIEHGCWIAIFKCFHYSDGEISGWEGGYRLRERDILRNGKLKSSKLIEKALGIK